MPDLTKYPKCKYHAKDPSRLVLSPEEEEALGPEWFDHPLLDKAPNYYKSVYKPGFEQEAEKADFPRKPAKVKV